MTATWPLGTTPATPADIACDELPAAPSTTALPTASGPTWNDLVDRVKEAGRYATTEEAARLTRTVLSALGGQVTGDERVALARRLPPEAARLIASRIPEPQPLPAAEFVDEVASRLDDATPATARWHVGSVLGALAHTLDDTLITRLLTHLPQGYALLFVRPQLILSA